MEREIAGHEFRNAYLASEARETETPSDREDSSYGSGHASLSVENYTSKWKAGAWRFPGIVANDITVEPLTTSR